MKAVVFDTETTGLEISPALPAHRRSRVTEFYGMYVSYNHKKKPRLLGECYHLINPEMDIPEEVTKITGISNKDVRGKPTFDKCAADIIKFLRKADVVIAHNAAFDLDILNGEFERTGFSCKWPRAVCTVEATEWLEGKKLNLSALHQHLTGEPHKNAHRAKEDVEALLRCVTIMEERKWI
jgi:DNA polymerase III epsilon subunit-like protein